jgi:4'-phosphopantetheinyl transferase
MPLVINKYEHSYRLALWKLSEPLSFFEEKANFSPSDTNTYQSIKNETRKKEWLAVRILLNDVLGFWPIITYMETGKPILNNHTRHLSISHSKEMVGILLSTNPYAGIDIENSNRNVDIIQKRFLSPTELETVSKSKNYGLNTIYWCAKEAIFKSLNEPNIEFSTRIFVKNVDLNGIILADYFSSEETRQYKLNFINIEEHWVVWTV